MISLMPNEGLAINLELDERTRLKQWATGAGYPATGGAALPDCVGSGGG
jgi:hypothetical protein